MTSSIPAPPKQLLEKLFRAGDHPEVLDSERTEALEWLRVVLVDFTVLNQHVDLLQQLYGDDTFRYPGSRRDGGSSQPPPPDSRFRFKDVWTSEKLLPTLEGGVNVLKNDELGELLLNPYAMADLHDMISDMDPDAWLPVLQKVGREMMRREHVGMQTRQQQERPQRPGPAQRPFSPKPNGRRTLWWAVGSSLATAAVMLIVFSTFYQALTKTTPPIDVPLVAEATPTYGPRQRGGVLESALTQLTVTSNRDGHVCIVFLEPKNRQFIIPVSGSEKEYLAKADGTPTTVDISDNADDATVAVVIVTETPADASVRKLLEARYTAAQVDEVVVTLQTGLKRLNFQRVSIIKIAITPGNKQNPS